MAWVRLGYFASNDAAPRAVTVDAIEWQLLMDQLMSATGSVAQKEAGLKNLVKQHLGQKWSDESSTWYRVSLDRFKDTLMTEEQWAKASLLFTDGDLAGDE